MLTKTTFPNGLTVLLKEIHTAPIISQWMWYRVGSRNETPGITGASHWVEHLLFKGTPRFPAGMLDRAIARDGGTWNAMTYLDWTTYYQTMPADKIALALELEADRMVNSIFDPQEVESERTVILAEREGSENDPFFRLSEAVQTAAFTAHPYRNEVIGSKEDLRTMQRADLYAHYRAHYVPNNAVLALAGDFDAPTLLEKLHTLYDSIPAGNLPPQEIPPDPPLAAETQIVQHAPGETAYLLAAYRAPQATHRDFFPLTVLDSLLCGPTNLNMFGAGIANRTSRLYQRLVEGGSAVGIWGGLQATIDPSLYQIAAVIHPQVNPAETLTALDDEIARLQDTPPAEEEVARAVKQARAMFAYGSESISNQAFWLGYAEMLDTYAWFEDYLNRLAAVTPTDVQRAAQTYLNRNARVLGISLPDSEGE
ncbi:MAG: hypothetical protein OHK0052_01700 [Anaerolineales bacterium]